ncbi:hypothetical protein CVU37_14980, partial [candidate division BRC1 bacterium HGW-BRC1-1]
TANTAVVDSTTTETDPTDNTTTPPVTVDVVPAANLTITKTASVSEIALGETFTYTIVVTNNGPSVAEDVFTTDTLPSGITFLSATPASVTEAGGVVVGDLGDIAAGGSVTIVITVRADAVGPTVNTAVVDSSTTDIDTTDNTTDPPTSVDVIPAAELSITKSASTSVAPLGTQFDYTLTVTNNGPSTAQAVQVVDTLPAGVAWVSGSASQGSVSETGGVVTALLGDMLAGGSATITITVEAVTVGVVSNTAAVDSTTSDTNTINNDADPVDVDVIPAADLAITKTASTDIAPLGTQFDYTITVANNGPSTAEDVYTTDTLPAGTAFVSGSATQGSVSESGGVVIGDLGDIAPATSVTVTITVETVAEGPTSNTAVVDSSTTDIDTTDNTTTPPVTVDVVPGADLQVTKTASTNFIAQGQQVTYQVVVTNAGPSTADNVVVTDTLASGLDFVGASTTSGTVSQSGGVVTALIGDLPAGSSATVTITVAGGDAGLWPNVAVADTATSETAPGDNISSPPVTVTVVPNADLSITKTASATNVPIGVDFTYTIRVTNNGQSAAEDVLVTDVLPAGVTYQSSTATQGFVGVSGQTVQADLGTVASGATVVITITVRGSVEGTVFNSASVDSNTSDTTPGNNVVAVPVEVTLEPSSDLMLFKVGDPNPVISGGEVTYFIMVANAGPSDATNVTMVDTLPTVCVEFISASTIQGTVSHSSGIVTANLGTLPAGESTLVQVVIRASGDTTLVNAAAVTGDEFDANLSNNNDTENTDLYSSFDAIVTDDITTDTGWFAYRPDEPGFHGTEWDPTEESLKAYVYADPVKKRTRQTGYFATESLYVPYASVGSENYVRGKFYIYTGDQPAANPLLTIPPMRLRLASRFAVNSMLEVFPSLNVDPGAAPVSLEFRPSTDPTKPSIYRVDFDPVDVPYLKGNPTTEGVMSGFEVFAIDPQSEGFIALAQIEIGVYPVGLLSTDCKPITKIFAPTATDAGDFRLDLPEAELASYNLLPVVEEGYTTVSVTDPPSIKPVYAEGSFGVTLDTKQVPSNRIGIISRNFSGGTDVTAPDYLRVSENKQYLVRYHLTSTQRSDRNSQIRLRGRAVRFTWSQKYELGGAWALGGFGSPNNTIAQQALPGIGCLNPDNAGTTNGGWYTMLMHSPMNVDIRPEFPTGTPLATRMPQLVAQPGPGVNAPSLRDLRFGLDIVDTITFNAQSSFEQGNVTVDRIEVTEFPLVQD